MTKETKDLLKTNNKMEEQMSKFSNKICTDMIVYLRGSDITEYNQELVRRDIIQMIIEGEKRGDDINKTMGDNYKEICDEIISIFPKKTVKEKIVDFIQMTLLCTWVLNFVYICKTLIINLVSKRDLLTFTLSVGDIINIILIICLANFVVSTICKNAFEESIIKNKVTGFLVTWVLCMLIIGGMLGNAYVFTYVVIDINIIWVAILTAILFIGDKSISSRI